jgi:Ulp1 family protease
MSTFLYPQLVKVDQYNDDKIKRFLKKKIRSTTQYLLIPINLESHGHWSLAIIANLNLQVPSDSSLLDPSTSSILYLDSIMRILPETKLALLRCVRIAHELLDLSPPTKPSSDNQHQLMETSSLQGT